MMAHLHWIKIIFICYMLIDVTISQDVWKVILQKNTIYATKSEDITINCTVHYPKQSRDSIQAFWKKYEQGTHEKAMNFILHSNKLSVIEQFRGRTKQIGNIRENNCSLLINNIHENDVGKYYLRVESTYNNYSFVNDLVSINVGDHIHDVSETTKPSMETLASPSLVTTSTGIFIPVMLTLTVAGIVATFGFLRRRRRSRGNTNHSTNYYENFKMPPRMQDDGEEVIEKHNKEQESPHTPQEEPIYKNVQECLEEGTVDCDEMDSLYCNTAVLYEQQSHKNFSG